MMFPWLKGKSQLVAPISGKLVHLNEVNDPLFSEGHIGKGVGIYPDTNLVKCPISGHVSMVFPTKHAIGITRSDGLEVLIHVGIDTVSLKGQGFDTVVNLGQKIASGDALMTFDLDYLLSQDIDPTVLVVITNSQDFDIKIHDSIKKMSIGDEIIDAEKKE